MCRESMKGPEEARTLHALMGRRRMLAMLAHGALALAARPGLAAAPASVVVMTGYPEEVMARFEAGFERRYPQYRLRILWRMPGDALPYLSQPGQGGVDVYWSASPRTFSRLKQAGAFQPLGIERAGLPEKIGAIQLTDPDGYFTASEMAGYGFVYDPDALSGLGVSVPKDWSGLADPRLAGRIAVPNPARVGFAPVMVDIVLQCYGWERGWALWSEIAGLATLIGSGGRRVAEEIGPDRAAIGLSIDFFIAAAIAGGAPLRFAYPAQGGINPAHIAITADAGNVEGARAFVEFVLSDDGQRLLADPDIRKLPVRPSAYAGLPADYHNPFVVASAGGYRYDNEAGCERLALVSSIFEQMFAQGHERFVSIWARLHAAERSGHDMRAARARLCAPPLDEQRAADPALLALFRERLEGAENVDGAALQQVEVGWQWSAAVARSEVERLLDGAGA